MSSTTLVSEKDLALYLDVTDIKAERATMMIQLAQAECEAVLSPLPVQAAGILLRIAARGYTAATGARSAQLAAAGGPMASAPLSASGVYRTSKDEYDLIKLGESLQGGSDAFTIRLHPGGPLRSPDADGGWSQAGWSNGWGNYGDHGPYAQGYGPW